MACIEKSKDIVDYLVSITPICIAIFMAFIAKRQAKIAHNKLRLDLYNKRFGVYEAVLSFYKAILAYDRSFHDDFEPKLQSLIKAERESKFLFDSGSGINKIINEMISNSFKYTGFKSISEELARGDPDLFHEKFNESQIIVHEFPRQIDRIDEAIAPYLNFNKIVN